MNGLKFFKKDLFSYLYMVELNTCSYSYQKIIGISESCVKLESSEELHKVTSDEK